MVGLPCYIKQPLILSYKFKVQPVSIICFLIMFYCLLGRLSVDELFSFNKVGVLQQKCNGVFKKLQETKVFDKKLLNAINEPL